MKRFICTALIALLCSVGAFAQTAGVAFADGPAVLTSVGQSADIEMVRVLLNRARVPFSVDATIQANGLTPNDGSLVLVVGGSSKGLGAAGISVDAELARARALVARARELNMSIITVHVGGAARRGPLSDGFIRFAIPISDYVIAVSSGDNDGLFTALANEANIPFSSVGRTAEVGTPLAAAFR